MGKEDKKKRIIEAAYIVFAKKGYINASIKDIANEANVAPGLVHYYFENKLEVLLSVQKHVQDQYHQLYKNKEVNSLSLHNALEEIKTRAETDPDWYRWRYEIYSLGLKSNDLQLEAAKILKDGRDSLSLPIKKLGESNGDPEIFASILLACFDGLALQKIIDPTFDSDKAYQLLKDLFEVYLKK
ncbi:TetR/AcrR family transcriptional regulator [Cytobacillus praedii]|uniref:TetR/AcrR family transcriptional regulator n=1 Tax=Cytobacillus praedii TaxID=1742358 RepID=A0A4R1AQ64_9BACI|nr:TetR/AcrR family transcriptional regulator [Cytobacillus praedii]TCJ01982.1 TetR/AcrR family transcriptional regulator [Cytobacillus praedii]